MFALCGYKTFDFVSDTDNNLHFWQLMPYNLFDKFKLDCKDHPESVKASYDALRDARVVYKLNTEDELLEFIGNGGLIGLYYIRKSEWRLNPKKNINKLYVYDYDCLVHNTPCYIAVVDTGILAEKTGKKWMLKSFHEQKDKKRLTWLQQKALVTGK